MTNDLELVKHPKIILINKTEVTVFSQGAISDDDALNIATDAVYDVNPDQTEALELRILADPVSNSYRVLGEQ